MAAKPLDREALTCPICLDLLEDPVTIPCGHSSCMKCLQNHWNQEVRYRCPQCRKSFKTRPLLNKNILLADLVEPLKTAEPSSELDAGPQDVPCEVCTGRKLKAVRSCLQCVVSFCEGHLQPHRDVPMLQKHQLVAPSNKLLENICHEHNKLKEIFCRTDQTIICYLCSVEKHKSHDMVSSAVERAQRQVQLEAQRDQLKNWANLKERDLQRVQREAQDITLNAQTAVQLSGDMFKDVALLLEKTRSEVEQQIRSEEQIQLRPVRELQDQLQQEVSELKRSISELEELFTSPDHNQVILHCHLLSTGSHRTESRIPTGCQEHFEDMTRALSALSDKLQLTLNQFKLPEKDLWFQDIDVDALVSEPLDSSMNKTREDFLKYSQNIRLDPDTAHSYLSLSEGNRRVKCVGRKLVSWFCAFPPQNQEREPFRVCQVHSRDGMTGRCYFEVDLWHKGWIKVRDARVAVSYRKRLKETDSGISVEDVFGGDDKSWALQIDRDQCSFWFNNFRFTLCGPRPSSTIGVYLDHSAGALSFYSVCDETMTLLHRVQTRFTQPLYAGVRLCYKGDKANFRKRK